MGVLPTAGCILIWLGFTHRGVYLQTRRALVVALALAAIVFLMFPAAPPRMLPGLGIHDTVGMDDHDAGSFHGISYNPYAAMPSMHVGWSLIVAGGVVRAVQSPWVRGIAIAHPLVMADHDDRDGQPLPPGLHRGRRDRRGRGAGRRQRNGDASALARACFGRAGRPARLSASAPTAAPRDVSGSAGMERPGMDAREQVRGWT